MIAIRHAFMSSFIKRVLDVVWYGCIVGLVIAMGFLIHTILSTGSLYFTLPVIFQPEPLHYQISAPELGVSNAIIRNAQGSLEISGAPPSSNYAKNMLELAVLLVVVYQLRKIFKTLMAANPFVADNATRIRFIGFAVIIGEILRTVLHCFQTFLVAKYCKAEGLELAFSFDLSLTNIFVGFAILILAEVFRMGTQIKEEQDLTV